MRRQGRVFAMQVLYQMDLLRVLRGATPGDADAALERYFDHFEAASPGERAYATRLVQGVARALPDLDVALSGASHHWKLTRMGRVDRSLLRLAAFEMLECADVPRNVAINEAVELAKTFGSQDSAAFVNGILDQLAVPPSVDLLAAAARPAAGAKEAYGPAQ